MKNTNLLVMGLIVLGITACGKGSSDSSSASGTATTQTSAVSSQLQNAQLVRTWVNTSDSAQLTINSDGSFNSTGCGLAGTVTSMNPYQQSQCPSGEATCGIVYLNVTSSTNGAGCVPTGAAICSYQTYAYNLMLNCGGGVSGSQLYQWQ